MTRFRVFSEQLYNMFKLPNGKEIDVFFNIFFVIVYTYAAIIVEQHLEMYE